MNRTDSPFDETEPYAALKDIAMTDRRHRVDHEFRRSLLAVPASVGLGRDLTEIHLNKWGLSSLVENSILVISELLTNAVAASPRQILGFALYALPGALMIEVSDPCDSPPCRRAVRPLDISGRGLLIVEHCAEQWGTRWPSVGGKIVWALLARRCDHDTADETPDRPLPCEPTSRSEIQGQVDLTDI